MEPNISVSVNFGSVLDFRYFVLRLAVMYVRILYYYEFKNKRLSKVLQNYTDSAFEQWYFSYRRFKWRLAPITNEIGRVMHSAHGTVVVPTIVSNDGRADMS
jgi:hypothetical protein